METRPQGNSGSTFNVRGVEFAVVSLTSGLEMNAHRVSPSTSDKRHLGFVGLYPDEQIALQLRNVNGNQRLVQIVLKGQFLDGTVARLGTDKPAFLMQSGAFGTITNLVVPDIFGGGTTKPIIPVVRDAVRERELANMPRDLKRLLEVLDVDIETAALKDAQSTLSIAVWEPSQGMSATNGLRSSLKPEWYGPHIGIVELVVASLVDQNIELANRKPGYWCPVCHEYHERKVDETFKSGFENLPAKRVHAPVAKLYVPGADMRVPA